MSITFQAGELIDHANGYKVYEPVLGDLECNVSNANGYSILEALCIEADPCGGLPINEFIGRGQVWLKRNIGKPSEEIEVTESRAAPDKCLVIDCGRQEGYLNRRIQELVMLAQEGKAKGATHFTWA